MCTLCVGRVRKMFKGEGDVIRSQLGVEEGSGFMRGCVETKKNVEGACTRFRGRA